MEDNLKIKKYYKSLLTIFAKNIYNLGDADALDFIDKVLNSEGNVDWMLTVEDVKEITDNFKYHIEQPTSTDDSRISETPKGKVG